MLWVSDSDHHMNESIINYFLSRKLRFVALINSISKSKITYVLVGLNTCVFSWLDYCNAVFTELCEKSIKRLQPIHSAARPGKLNKARKVDQINPVLRSLLYLSVARGAAQWLGYNGNG